MGMRVGAGSWAALSGDEAALLSGKETGIRHTSLEQCPPAVHVLGGCVQVTPSATGLHTDTEPAELRRGMLMSALGGTPAAPLFSAGQAGASDTGQTGPEAGGQGARGSSSGGTSEAIAWRGPRGCPTLSAASIAGRPQLRLEVLGGGESSSVCPDLLLSSSLPGLERTSHPPRGMSGPHRDRRTGTEMPPMATPSAEPGTARSAMWLPGSPPRAVPVCSPKRGMF